MTLLLRNMTVYTRFNRFQHRAINKDEKINRWREQVEKLKRNIMIPFRRPQHSMRNK